VPRGPELPDPAKSTAMAVQRQRDTRVEMDLRRELHRRGLRYRLQQRIVPGVPRRSVDIVFPRARVAVDCRACWWHGCLGHGSQPAKNRSWWLEKLASNRERDRDTERRLHEAGWQVIVAWEHDDPLLVADRVEAAVAAQRSS
jgi:DNA mismatch endonuclease (patch repair protein)